MNVPSWDLVLTACSSVSYFTRQHWHTYTYLDTKGLCTRKYRTQTGDIGSNTASKDRLECSSVNNMPGPPSRFPTKWPVLAISLNLYWCELLSSTRPLNLHAIPLYQPILVWFHEGYHNTALVIRANTTPFYWTKQSFTGPNSNYSKTAVKLRSCILTQSTWQL